MHLRILPDHQNQVLKKLFVSRLGWLKRVLMHLLILSDHYNQVLYKLSFSPLEWVKTCFYAFPGHQNQVLKYLFFHVWGGQKRVFMHLRILPYHQNQVLKK